MQRKSNDFVSTRTSRIDRFAQMSKVEQVIEQKKREIQARLGKTETSDSTDTNVVDSTNSNCELTTSEPENIKNGNSVINVFSNDGSFLDQFKQLSKEKEMEKKSEIIDEQCTEQIESVDGKNNDRLKSSRWSRDKDTNYDRFNNKRTNIRYDRTKNFNNSFNTNYNEANNSCSNIQPPPLMGTSYPPSLFAETIPPPPQLISSSLIPSKSVDIPTNTTVPPPNKSVPPPFINKPDLIAYPTINVPPPLPQPALSSSSADNITANIPALMAQPVLPPAGMNLCGLRTPLTIPPPNFLPTTTTTTVTTKSINNNSVCPIGSEIHAAMSSVARMVAQCGTSFEDAVRQRSHQDPNMWFLYETCSPAYKQYQELVAQFKSELNSSNEYKPEDLYEDEPDDDKTKSDDDQRAGRKRKRKSRWGEQTTSTDAKTNVMLTKVTRTDPALIQYAINTFGTSNLSDDDWQKAEDHYKINLLYQDMLRKRQELEQLQRAGKFKYEYDSDEEVDGGTWEHKIREQEMEATKLWATELTKKAEGKHHIGDFLPPEELRKFLEQSNAVKEGREPDLSDYKEYKLKSDNIGFKMLQKLGWNEGQGLGAEGSGIVEPVNKASQRDSNQGLGINTAGNISNNDDEYDAYRKRMMLAYRFRPNPLNNPRRPYY